MLVCVCVHFSVYWDWDLFSGYSPELHMQYLAALLAKKNIQITGSHGGHIHIQNTLWLFQYVLWVHVVFMKMSDIYVHGKWFNFYKVQYLSRCT